MTALQTHRSPPREAVTLRTLAGLEARRYARHPLFLVGLTLLVISQAAVANDASTQEVGTYFPGLMLGLLGLFVANRLTRSTSGAAEPVEAAPADGVIRTAALCLACLVPGAVAALWLISQLVAWKVWTPIGGWYVATDAGDRVGELAAGVVAAVGGPLVGVLIGRWLRFPGAALLGAVVLAGWAFLAAGALALEPSRIATLLRLTAPVAGWTSADGPDGPNWIAAGSPWAYVAYLAGLCGLAAVAAMLHDAVGRRRSRLLGAGGILLVIAIGCLVLAALPNPARVYL
jgi:hypothetical protein